MHFVLNVWPNAYIDMLKTREKKKSLSLTNLKWCEILLCEYLLYMGTWVCYVIVSMFSVHIYFNICELLHVK